MSLPSSLRGLYFELVFDWDLFSLNVPFDDIISGFRVSIRGLFPDLNAELLLWVFRACAFVNWVDTFDVAKFLWSWLKWSYGLLIRFCCFRCRVPAAALFGLVSVIESPGFSVIIVSLGALFTWGDLPGEKLLPPELEDWVAGGSFWTIWLLLFGNRGSSSFLDLFAVW